MLYFDLILMRMILAGLATVILAAVYLLTRKWLAHQVRSVILAVLLLLPLLAFVVMPAVSLPDSAPDWLLEMRLPDPARQPMTRDAIGAFIDDVREAEDPAKIELSKWLADKGYNPELHLSDWIVLALPVARLIYLAGVLISIITSLILAIRRLRRRNNFRASNDLSINKAAWQVEIADLRDKMGIYRQARIVLADRDEDHPWAILHNWHQRTIPVPTADPADVDPAQRLEWLIGQLRLSARPRRLIFVLWFVARCLIWFNPFFYWCQRTWTADFQHESNKTQSKRGGPARWIASAVAVLLVVVCLTIIVWQMPQSIKRDFRLIHAEGAPELAVEFVERLPIRTEPIIDWVFDQSLNTNVIARIDDAGNPIWSVPSHLIWAANEFPDPALSQAQLTSVQMSDQSWSIIANVRKYYSDAGFLDESAWHLHIDPNGALIDVRKIYDLTDTPADSETGVASTVLLNDGTYQMVSTKSQSARISSNINVSYDLISEYIRYDVDGNEIWRQAKNNQDGKFDSCYIYIYGQYGRAEYSSHNSITEFVPVHNDHAGLINYHGTASLVPRLDNDKRIFTDYSYQSAYRFICIDSTGNLLWQKDLTNLSDGTIINSKSFADGDMLYWLGSQFASYYDGTFSYTYAIYDSIIGLDTSTQKSWKLMLDEQIATNYYITQYVAQNDCLTLLLTGKGDSTNTSLICQLYRDGQLIGMTQLKDVEQPYLYRIVDASLGTVSLLRGME